MKLFGKKLKNTEALPLTPMGVGERGVGSPEFR